MKDKIVNKILDFYPIWFIRALFCKHNYVFHDNIYGDAIEHCGYKRSKWVCTKCRKIQYRDELLKDVNGDPYPSRLSIKMLSELGYEYNGKINKFTNNYDKNTMGRIRNCCSM